MPRPFESASVLEAIGREVSRISRYYDCMIQWCEPPDDAGRLAELAVCAEKRRVGALEHFPDLRGESERRTLILLHAEFDHGEDALKRLEELRPRLARTSRVAVVDSTRSFARPRFVISGLCKERGRGMPQLRSRPRLEQVMRSIGYDAVCIRPISCPSSCLGFRSLPERLMSAVSCLRRTSSARLIVLRPRVASMENPCVSVLVPARNERGNVASLLHRLPPLPGSRVEVVMVEGHSVDGTWEEMQRAAAEYRGPHRLKLLRQSGTGKCDAVRLAAFHATGDLLWILDADLSVPPEMLTRFYDAYRAGLGDVINGNRFILPMEGGAMRALNYLGNKAFAFLLRWLLAAPMGDCLCGSKMFARHDHRRFCRWREEFGDFDPFGDFEILFPAATLGIGIADLAIPYRARTYGDTQIRRFRDGWRLLKMVAAGVLALKMSR